MLVREIALIFALALLGACGTTVQEKHYFATFGPPSPGNPSGVQNIFRLNVDAQTGFSNVRYVAGTYDERAVELFLNETKSNSYPTAQSNTLGAQRGVFVWSCPETKPATPATDGSTAIDPCKSSYDAAMKLVPLSKGTPGQESGLDSFVIILSTDADAIAETIGAFATNTEAIQSMNYLLNRDTFDDLEVAVASAPFENSRSKAVTATLDGLFDKYEDSAVPSPDRELAILQTIAIAIEPNKAVGFKSIEEARAWFSTVN